MVDCSDDTIAAIASATGGALRGIVRLAGANCAQVVEKLFAPLAGERRLSEVKRARRVAGCLELGHPLGAVPAHILLWPGARSYVRQPSAEIHTLGSPPLLAQLLERLCQSGARIARPGEFTLRAFLAGRIDLTQAEAVLGVIDARDQRELHGALTQLAGGLSGPLFAIRSGLLDLLAHLEAGLDFVDEDIEFISKEELNRRLQDAAVQIERLANQLECRGITGSLPRVVLAGPPNAGKSSLLNALCGNPQAIVSAVAGTTRDYVSVRTRCGELEVELIDTAGIDESVPSGSVAAAARDIAQAQAESADLLLVCHEEPHPAGSGGDNCLLVLTKCDQPTERREIIPGTFLTSSRTGQGIEPLKAAIESSLAAQSPDVPMVASTAARCRESLLLAADSLNRAQAAANAAGEEFVAAEVRCALDDLGRVVGAIYTDDVLDRIFTSFCIGK